MRWRRHSFSILELITQRLLKIPGRFWWCSECFILRQSWVMVSVRFSDWFLNNIILELFDEIKLTNFETYFRAIFLSWLAASALLWLIVKFLALTEAHKRRNFVIKRRTILAFCMCLIRSLGILRVFIFLLVIEGHRIISLMWSLLFLKILLLSKVHLNY